MKVIQAFLTVCFCLIYSLAFSQTFTKQWDKRYGGSKMESFYDVLLTSNNKLIICGASWSDSSGDKTEHTRDVSSLRDIWIVRLDSNGTKLWDKTLGGNREDDGLVILETKDHKFLIGGATDSDSSGDITHPNINTTQPYPDFLLLKIDSNGQKIWDKRYGGDNSDAMFSMVSTDDGGYLLGGSSNSGISGDKTDFNRGGLDIWLIKIDSLGNKLWDKTYGGNGNDDLNKIIKTFDGGYLLTGHSNSGISGEKSQFNWDTNGDYWIVKIDSAGNKLWDRRYGGTSSDVATDCSQMADSGFMLFGGTSSGISGDKTTPLLGMTDYWLVRTDKNGNKLWDKKNGGSNYDDAGFFSKTTDQGFLLGGNSSSGVGGEKTEANLSGFTGWIVKTDSVGNKQWDKTLQIQGSLNGASYVRAIEAYTNCYYFVCSPDAGVGGDKSEDSRGYNDYWISKWIYNLPQPVAAFQSNDTVFCANDCIDFINQSTNATSWQWSFDGGNPSSSNAQNPQGICYLNQGTYNVALIVSNSSGSDTLTFTNYISVHPAPIVPTINKVGNALYCVTDPSYTSYQWYFQDTLIAGATDTFYVATQSGNYNVEVKDENGCTVGTGINVTVGVNELGLESRELGVWPNPAGKELRIENGKLRIEKIEIYSVLGERIYSQQSDPTRAGVNPKSAIKIDVSAFSAGIYFVQVLDGTQRFVSKFVKE